MSDIGIATMIILSAVYLSPDLTPTARMALSTAAMVGALIGILIKVTA